MRKLTPVRCLLLLSLPAYFTPAVVLIEACELMKGLLDSPAALAAMQQVRGTAVVVSSLVCAARVCDEAAAALLFLSLLLMMMSFPLSLCQCSIQLAGWHPHSS